MSTFKQVKMYMYQKIVFFLIVLTGAPNEENFSKILEISFSAFLHCFRPF